MPIDSISYSFHQNNLQVFYMLSSCSFQAEPDAATLFLWYDHSFSIIRRLPHFPYSLFFFKAWDLSWKKSYLKHCFGSKLITSSLPQLPSTDKKLLFSVCEKSFFFHRSLSNFFTVLEPFYCNTVSDSFLILEERCPRYLSPSFLQKYILGALRHDQQFVMMNTVSSLGAVNSFLIFVKGHIISSSTWKRKGRKNKESFFLLPCANGNKCYCETPMYAFHGVIVCSHRRKDLCCLTTFILNFKGIAGQKRLCYLPYRII